MALRVTLAALFGLTLTLYGCGDMVIETRTSLSGDDEGEDEGEEEADPYYWVEFDWNSGFLGEENRAATYTTDHVLTFSWEGTHDITELPDLAAFEACDFSAASKTPMCSYSGQCDLIVPEGVTYYACSIGSHCENGQKLALTGTVP